MQALTLTEKAIGKYFGSEKKYTIASLLQKNNISQKARILMMPLHYYLPQDFRCIELENLYTSGLSQAISEILNENEIDEKKILAEAVSLKEKHTDPQDSWRLRYIVYVISSPGSEKINYCDTCTDPETVFSYIKQYLKRYDTYYKN